MKNFHAVIQKFEAQVADLRAKVFLLEEQNEELKTQNKLQAQEIKKLKDRLSLNSKNSSIPSSKELYKIKKNHRSKSSKNRGAQPGHEGSFRSKMQAHEIVCVSLNQTHCECGGELRFEQNPKVHQTVEVPEIQPHVVDYHFQRARCCRCGKRKTAPFKEGLSQKTFGPGVETLVSSLTAFYKNSKREVQSLLKDVFNLSLSVGTISSIESRVSDKCSSVYEDIEESLSWSPLIHIDETGHQKGEKRGWCWIFTSLEETLLKMESSRGKKVLKQSVLGPENGFIVSDRYPAYHYFEEETRQICWAHLRRDFSRLSHSVYPEAREPGLHLERLCLELFSLKHHFERGQVDRLFFLRRCRRLRKKVHYYLNRLLDIPEAPRVHGVVKNLLKHESMMWRLYLFSC